MNYILNEHYPCADTAVHVLFQYQEMDDNVVKGTKTLTPMADDSVLLRGSIEEANDGVHEIERRLGSSGRQH